MLLDKSQYRRPVDFPTIKSQHLPHKHELTIHSSFSRTKLKILNLKNHPTTPTIIFFIFITAVAYLNLN